MKKFNFRLERILRYKGQIEDQRRQDLAARMEELSFHKSVLLQMTSHRQAYLRKYSDQFKGRIDINSLKVTSRFLEKLFREMMLQAKKTVECEKRVERAKAGLLEAMRDRKKFDNLKARKFKAYEKLAGRLEQKELDAFGSQMMLRRSKTRAATQAASRM